MKKTKCYIIIFTVRFQKKNRKEEQNMKKARTFAGVEKERKRATTLRNNNQAKRLALLIIYEKQTM
mgnify:CR=1 FL=1